MRKTTSLLPKLVSPKLAEVRMSMPTGQLRVGVRADGGLLLLLLLEEVVEMETHTPLLSRPSRYRRASYMFSAFLSTLFTITDYTQIIRHAIWSYRPAPSIHFEFFFNISVFFCVGF